MSMRSETSQAALQLSLCLSYRIVFTACCFGVLCGASGICCGLHSWPLRLLVFAVVVGDLGQVDVLVPWVGDLLLAVHLQSAGCVSDSSLLPHGAGSSANWSRMAPGPPLKAQTAHQLRAEHLPILVCELGRSNDGSCLILAHA